jgi:hypothetical protein
LSKVTLNTIGSRYGSIDALNNNFDEIEDAIENTLSRDGTSPNEMLAPLNMGNNRVINVLPGTSPNDAVTLGQLTQASSDIFVSDTETIVATEGQTTVTFNSLTYSPGLNALLVFVNGSKQRLSFDYNEITPTSIVFSQPLNGGDIIEVVTSVPTSTVAIESVGSSYTQVGVYTATGGETVVTSPVGSFLQGQNHLKVYRNGVFQTIFNDYNESGAGNAITFLSALEAGDRITFVKNSVGEELEVQPASVIPYIPAGTGAVATNVQAKLRESQTTQDHDTATNSWAAAASLATGGFWDDDAPAGRLFRFADRVFVGDAATEGGGKRAPGVEKSWVGNSAGGFMTYFESRSTFSSFSQIGSIGVAGAARSSDNDRAGELNTIGGGFFAKNDNTNAADKKSVWAIYGHASQEADNRFTTALELDVCSTQTLVGVTPYTMAGTGVTATSWFGVGGETAQQLVEAGSGASLTNVSCALGIINSASGAANNRYAKGIVFQATSLAGTDGVTGTGVAVEMAKGHELTWKFSSGASAFAGLIRGDGATGATHQRLVMGNSNFQVRGVQDDLTTEQPLFSVTAPSMGAAAVNYVSLSPGLAGSTITTVGAAGPDTNIDIRLQPKGAGILRLDYSTTAATVPANFAANRRLAFKDSSGTTYYIPCMGVTW